MNVSRFVDERRGLWRRLEHLLHRAEREGISCLSADEVRDLARLYRSASADLLLARSAPGTDEVVAYLETVVARAYVYIHTPSPVQWRRLLVWATHRFPASVRRWRPFVLGSWAVFALGFLLAFVLTLADTAAFDHLVPASIASFYGDQPEDYRAERFGDMGSGNAARFSSELMVNNIRVTLQAFALGLTLGIGTVAVLFGNGVLLGALAANFLRWGMSIPFWALILPHGVTEIFAIVLGGAGGLMLADALLRPGSSSRAAALRKRGPEALALAGMAVPLLVFAGIVEAYLTPLEWLPDVGKLGFALLCVAALGLWLRAPWLDDSAAPAPPAAGYEQASVASRQ